MDFTLPETRYALSGDVSIADQVIGDGPVDIITVAGLTSHIEFMNGSPAIPPFYAALPSSLVSLSSINAARDCRTRSQARHRWNCVWTMSAPLWTRSARAVPRSLDFPRAAR